MGRSPRRTSEPRLILRARAMPRISRRTRSHNANAGKTTPTWRTARRRRRGGLARLSRRSDSAQAPGHRALAHPPPPRPPVTPATPPCLARPGNRGAPYTHHSTPATPLYSQHITSTPRRSAAGLKKVMSLHQYNLNPRRRPPGTAGEHPRIPQQPRRPRRNRCAWVTAHPLTPPHPPTRAAPAAPATGTSAPCTDPAARRLAFPPTP